MSQIQYTDPGAFYFLISLVDPEPGRNSDGTKLPPSVFAQNIQAAIVNISYRSGTEIAKIQRLIPEITHEVIIKYMPGVLTRMLVKFRDRTFVIMRIVDPDERMVELHLICSERNDGK